MESHPLKLVFLVVIFATITCSSGDMPRPTGTVTDVDLNDFSRKGISLTFKVSVKNPYAPSIPIFSADCIFKSGTKVVASGNIPNPGSLRGHGNTLVDVRVTVPHFELVSLFKNVSGDEDIDYDVEIKLEVDLPVVGHYTIPVHKNGEMKLSPFRSQYV